MGLFHENAVFDSYLTHLAEGLPANAWCMTDRQKDKKSYITAKSISQHLGNLFDISLVDLAKAKGVHVRFRQMKNLAQDPKTALPNLAVFKALNEIFFTDLVNEVLDPGLLMKTINEIIAKEMPASDVYDEGWAEIEDISAEKKLPLSIQPQDI